MTIEERLDAGQQRPTDSWWLTKGKWLTTKCWADHGYRAHQENPPATTEVGLCDEHFELYRDPEAETL